ncbi:MAG: hypothetical protein ISS72_06285, partial [Candidatus Brocadiae bacterium]|nr:hypothetical protein [Candidatus Brocadiia bacterium]
MTPDPHATPDGAVAGSYRDPTGYVFWRQGRLFRSVDAEGLAVLDGLWASGLLPRLIDRGLIVGTHKVDEPEMLGALRAEHAGHAGFLEHQVLPTITYPYEWTVSMLADAGTHTLDLQIQLLDAGCALKDATAYNIQFAQSRPIFIDLTSIERPQRLDLWFALGQFMQMFLYPLLLTRYRGWDLRSYFRPSIGGRSIEEVARSFGWLGRLRPALLLDLTLPLWLHRWAEKGQRAKRDVL